MMQRIKEWAAAAAMRGIRTFAEGVLIYIGGDAVKVGQLVISDVDWMAALSAGAMGFVIAILMAVIAGLPEVKSEPKEPEQETEKAE